MKVFRWLKNNGKRLTMVGFMVLIAYVLDTKLLGYALFGFIAVILGFAAYRLIMGWDEYKRIVDLGTSMLQIQFPKKTKKVKTKVKK